MATEPPTTTTTTTERVDEVDVVVLGAGISGLSAAWFLSEQRPDRRIMVLEADTQLGGKLRLGRLDTPSGPITLDLGAESMLARRPEGIDLVRAAGLGTDLVHPATAAASVMVDGQLRALPGGTLLGVPNDPRTLIGFLTAEQVQRAMQEAGAPAEPLTHDVDVAGWVRERFGPAVLDTLVEPLLGGVYAGRADLLSLQATVPALWALACAGGPVTGRLPVSGPPDPIGAAAAPVFAGIRGGVGRLPIELAARLRERGVQVRTARLATGLHPDRHGWQVQHTTPGAGAPGQATSVRARAVLVALPPAAAARLLRPVSAAAAAGLTQIPTASMAVIAMALPAEQTLDLPGSGVLVPPAEQRLVKAVTFAAAKWAWLAQSCGPDVRVIRASVGRFGAEQDLHQPDDSLVTAVHADLQRLLGRTLTPGSTRVQRWGGGLPQYTVGHLDRIATIRAAVAEHPGLAICGAAFDGVGIPACIRSAASAVTGLLPTLDQPPIGAGAQ